MSRGIAVGNKQDYKDLSNFLFENKVSLQSILHPEIFGFEDSAAAFDCLQNKVDRVGKIVIKM